uniref:Uncharacterized protein n=1 Tax=Trichuris muris TaxID=70415 RepID=A0A5S6QZD5_TRIMR
MMRRSQLKGEGSARGKNDLIDLDCSPAGLPNWVAHGKAVRPLGARSLIDQTVLQMDHLPPTESTASLLAFDQSETDVFLTDSDYERLSSITFNEGTLFARVAKCPDEIVAAATRKAVRPKEETGSKELPRSLAKYQALPKFPKLKTKERQPLDATRLLNVGSFSKWFTKGSPSDVHKPSQQKSVLPTKQGGAMGFTKGSPSDVHPSQQKKVLPATQSGAKWFTKGSPSDVHKPGQQKSVLPTTQSGAKEFTKGSPSDVHKPSQQKQVIPNIQSCAKIPEDNPKVKPDRKIAKCAPVGIKKKNRRTKKGLPITSTPIYRAANPNWTISGDGFYRENKASLLRRMMINKSKAKTKQFGPRGRSCL